VRVLQSWEDTHKQVKLIAKERNFLREKLESFLKMQVPQVAGAAVSATEEAKGTVFEYPYF
jgi:hypothetical protein